MELQLFKTLWGHQGMFKEACEQVEAAGFQGVEGQAPLDKKLQQSWLSELKDRQLDFIGEVCTAGSYVPDRHAPLQTHLDSLQQGIEASLALNARFVTCLGGCDAWSETDSLKFFEQAIGMEERYGIALSFETHRGRSLFNPWVTLRVCQRLPELKLTCDFSHWCVVCERLLDGEESLLENIFKQAFHIHARVGYDQGAQVPDPRSDRYRQALEQHQSWWHFIWMSQQERGFRQTTMTPEFGPDGYQAIDPTSDKAIGDLWEINTWMANQQRQQFNRFSVHPENATCDRVLVGGNI